ncbi:c-type cytochrome [Plastorhodobacter daqingensis]|uniref:C-type cytochrome n=1 Tax=Plastorhodobacter daqingensis TaxID=1387281 RepID=A0ABW2UJD7_9RHOB
MKCLCSLSLFAALALAGPVAAQDLPPEVVARKAQFKELQDHLAVLGNMARGTAPYDAGAADQAARAISEVAARDQSGLWPEGTDSANLAGTRALPAIWENPEDFAARFEGLRLAAGQMEAAAGRDLAALQGEIGNLSGACGACHRPFRAPE